MKCRYCGSEKKQMVKLKYSWYNEIVHRPNCKLLQPSIAEMRRMRIKQAKEVGKK